MAKDGDSLYHINTVRAATYIFVNVLLSILLIWIFARLEPTINRQFFSHLSEAENQTYMLGLAIFFSCQILLYPLIKNSTNKEFPVPKNTLLLILLTIDAAMVFVSYTVSVKILHSQSLQDIVKLIEIYEVKKLTSWHFFLGELITLLVAFLLVPTMNWSRRTKIIFHTIAIIIIIWMTMGFGNLNLYDYANYAGPINDLLLGKPLFTYRASYGTLPILLLSLIFHVLPLTSQYLTMEIAVFGTLGFLLYYALALTILKDLRWTFITTICAIFVSHLVVHGATYQIPQRSFVRMGMWILVALLLGHKTLFMKKFRRLGEYLPIVLVSISFFWSADFGLYSLIAYFLYLFITNLHIKITLFIKKSILALCKLIVSLIGVFTIINILYFLWYRSFPMWMTYYFSVFTYQNSGTMVPVPHVPALWIYILIPITTISFILYKKKVLGALNDNDHAVLFSACVGLTTFNYFLGRSFLNSLNALSPPVIVCLFYLCKATIDMLKKFSVQATFAGAFFIGTLLSVPATLFAYQGIHTLQFANPRNTLRILALSMPGVTDEYFWVGPTAQALTEKYGDEIRTGNLTMLSTWDTWFLVIYHTANRAGLNCLICYYFPADDLTFIIENIKKSPSQYLFVDSNRILEGGRVEYLLSRVKNQYDYVETIGFLDVYQKRK